MEFYLGQILFLYQAKKFGEIFDPNIYLHKGQYLAQIKIQIIIGCVDAALAGRNKRKGEGIYQDAGEKNFNSPTAKEVNGSTSAVSEPR